MGTTSCICFLFPGDGFSPCGGLKVILEYGNRLVRDGHEVHIAYAGSIFWKQKSLFHKGTAILRYIQHYFRGYSARGWFPLDSRVKEHFCFSLSESHVPEADIYIATSPHTAIYLQKYRKSCRKYYFLQGFENWGQFSKADVLRTYRFPFQKIVISQWLADIVRGEGEECHLVPNGFDFQRFSLSVPIEKKDPYRVTMLYHTMARKDCPTGFKALTLVHQKYPQLRVNLFGVPERPDNLPEWMDYYQQPDAKTHNRIYNEAAIYLGTSQTEGWGLTVGEAMICGQAVVCTDNPGYLEMARDGLNALVAPVGDAETLAKKMIQLIEEPALRLTLATQGNKDIQNFTWEKAYDKFKKALGVK